VYYPSTTYFTPLLEKWMYVRDLPEVTAAAIVDETGAWCPNCKNRKSFKTTAGTGCVFWVFVIVSMGLALIMIPFLPKTWHCQVCGHQWRA